MWMKHPDMSDNRPVEAAESAFSRVWRPRGWVETDPPDDTLQTTEPAGNGGLSHSQTESPAPTPARKRKET